MKIPLWIGGPTVIVLSAIDAAITLQNCLVSALARAVISGMGSVAPMQLANYPVDGGEAIELACVECGPCATTSGIVRQTVDSVLP